MRLAGHPGTMPVPRLELQDVEAVVTREVGEGGRISGLSEYIGLKVLVVVPVQPEPAKKRRRPAADALGK